MNFNLALICTDGRFADARAFSAFCSTPATSPPIWEESSGFRLRSLGSSPQRLLAQRYQPGPSTPRETQDAQKMGKNFANAGGIHM